MATCESPLLLENLQLHAGTIENQGPIASEDWLNLPKGVDVFHVASRAGRTYLLDPAMVITSNLDLAQMISRSLGCVVASVGAETVSGTYWLVAVVGGRLRRLHWNVRADLTEAFDLGEPFAAERRVPLEDVDGNGLIACLAELGFDPEVMTAPTGGGERYAWTAEQLPTPGPLETQINGHAELHRRSAGEDWTKHIKAVSRKGGGFDLQYQPPSEKPPVLKRLFRR